MTRPSATLVPLLLLAVAMAGSLRGQQPLALRVVDAETGTAIRGARAVNGNQTVGRSGADGLLEIAALSPRGVMVSKAGYVAQSLANAANGQLRLQRGAVLVVYLFDGAGAPRAPESVKLECQKLSRGVGSYDQGAVRISGVPPGKCTLRPGFTGTHVMMPGRPIEAEIRVAIELKLKESLARARAPAPEGIEVELRAGEELTIGLREEPERPSVVTLPGLGTTGAGSVEGRVLDVNGQPGAGVPVVLRSAATASTVFTDSSGRFLFTQVPDGDFTVMPLLRSPLPTRTVSVAVRGGQALTGVVIQDLLVGEVSGQVLDEFGDPAEGVRVQLFRANEFANGLRIAAMGGVTDDRGVYRILAPSGSYRVGATIGGARRPEELILSPGAAVDVRAGVSLSGVNVSDTRTSAGAIRGVAVTSGGKPAPGASALLVSTRDVASVLAFMDTPAVRQQVALSTAGVFSFEGLSPGDYEVFVTAPPLPFVIVTHQNGVPTGASAPATEFAHARVTVRAGGLELGLQTARGSSLRGRVEFEGGSAGQSFSGIQFMLPIATRQPSARLPAGTQSDGSFGIDDLSARTRIIARLPDEGWWLKSFMVNGVNAADEPVDFAGGGQSSTSVRAVLARTARISGTLTDDSGKPMRRLVHAFPVERDRRYPQSRYVVVKVADHDGRFTLSVPPGTYWVVSAVETRVGPFDEDELLKLESRATLTTVAEGQEAQTALRFVPKF